MEEDAESEQFSDNFTCAVCLDVLYKPIVLVCGHVSCFWCCQHSMHMRSESHCPLCRNPYHHFPAICHTLHFLLKKLYPISYNRRNIQTLEDEKHSTLGFSLDIDSLVTSEEKNSLEKVGQSSNVSFEDEFSVDCYTKTKKLKESSSRTYKQISVSDVPCAACKQLLFRPVVLNCGHVYCEGCVTIPTEGMLKCQVCKCRHPSGFPKVCRELDHFLEEQFSSEYALRRSIIQQKQEQNQSTNSSNDTSTQSPKLSFPTKENFLQWLTAHDSKLHDCVGCDVCGMCPILGDRYRCKDCTEKCGYDLCGDCYKTGSKLPGRFNQKHTPTHRLELVKSIRNRNAIYRLLRGQLAIVSSRSEPSLNNGSPNLPFPPLEEDSVSSASSEDQSDNQPLI
ncbi:hypothetical protein L1987_50640 [Smallanthus sonchifolius]|uniref:Uncharacterized protein n=1 Tax=Smallanthus sonchifolius TaxID=185202 RepID=A0ACB9EN35_9ASTR|nr:hypothetical protein L1987_50640 [Smallanthus sonchifolius]